MILGLLVFFNSVFVSAAGFKGGAQYVAFPISGQVSISCTSPDTEQVTSVFNCRDNVLEPSPYDYFSGPMLSAASHLVLRDQHADGGLREKNASYDGNQGISGVVNLWIHTLFQTPLLSYGENKIQYVLQDSQGQALSQGDFSVNVDTGDSRICPTTYYTSTDASNCDSQYSVCQRYFEQFNSCR